MKFRFSKIYLLIVLCFVATSCVPATVEVDVLRPNDTDASTFRDSIAVLPIDNDQPLASRVEAALFNHKLNDQNYFGLVERRNLDKALDEINISEDYVMDDDTATKIGKLAGAKAVLFGSYQENMEERSYEDTRFNILTRESYEVSCVERIVTFRLLPKIILPETAKIVYADNLSSSQKKEICGDNSGETLADLLDIAIGEVIEQVIQSLAPYIETLEVKLIEDTESVLPEAEENYLNGVEFAKDQRMDRACGLWNTASSQSPTSYAIIYSLGICAEVDGNLTQALEFYKIADGYLVTPNDIINESLARVQNLIDERDKLN